MGFLRRVFGRKPKLIKLLSAHIVADEGHRYFVSFSKHHPDLRSTEFVRLVLYYYARILFNFDPTDPSMSQSAWILKNMVQSLLDKGIQANSEIFKNADIDDIAAVVSATPENGNFQFKAELYFIDTLRRRLTTEVPKKATAQHAVFSVMALTQAVLIEMDQYCIDVLVRALTSMNDAYDSGQSFSDLKNVEAIPAGAYTSALMSV